MRFAEQTLTEIRERAELLEIVQEQVVLKKAGREHKGLCPFHEERTPSFTVNPAKNYYYCHGCGKGGDALRFIQDTNRMSFADAVLHLAERYQIEIRLQDAEDEQALKEKLLLQKRLFEMNEAACIWFQMQLRREQANNSPSWQYLMSRKTNIKEISEWRLGFAPKSWQGLLDHLKQKGFSLELLQKASLASSKDGRAFDFFRNRLIIPLLDEHSRVVGFSGRAITPEDSPKYLHSAETEIFQKGRYLFGMHRAVEAIAKAEQVIFTEGQFDVIAMHRAGVKNVVASMGTSLSIGHIRQAIRHTTSKRFLLLFDSDKAGQGAVGRVLTEASPLIQAGQVSVSVLTLAGKDPDEFLSQHPIEELQQLIMEAQSWFDWKLGRIISDKDLDDVSSFQQASRDTVELLKSLPDAANRSNALRRCAEKLGRGKPALVRRLEEDLSNHLRGNRQKSKNLKIQKSGHLEKAELKLLQVYLHCPDIREEFRSMLEGYQVGFTARAGDWEQILEIEAQGSSNLFAQWLAIQEKGCPKELMPDAEAENIESAMPLVLLCICQLEKVGLQAELEELQAQWIENGDDELAAKIYDLKQRIREVDNMRKAGSLAF
jgi:DNA primase